VKLEGTEQKLTPTRHKPIREQEKNERRIQTFQKGGVLIEDLFFFQGIFTIDWDFWPNLRPDIQLKSQKMQLSPSF
jgi:hypothetical protein